MHAMKRLTSACALALAAALVATGCGSDDDSKSDSNDSKTTSAEESGEEESEEEVTDEERQAYTDEMVAISAAVEASVGSAIPETGELTPEFVDVLLGIYTGAIEDVEALEAPSDIEDVHADFLAAKQEQMEFIDTELRESVGEGLTAEDSLTLLTELQENEVFTQDEAFEQRFRDAGYDEIADTLADDDAAAADTEEEMTEEAPAEEG